MLVTQRFAAGLVFAMVYGCAFEGAPDDWSYYDENIAPTISASCGGPLVGCHLSDERGTAPGNLDVSSYDSLRRRTDLLIEYGPYPRPMLLIRAGDQVPVTVSTLDGSVEVTTDVPHAGGRILRRGTQGFGRLLQWLDQGYTRTGIPRDDHLENTGDCASGPGHTSGFSASAEPEHLELFRQFVEDVQPVLVDSCGGTACHGARLADFHLACGDTPEEQRWNYWISTRHLAAIPEQAEIVKKPLAASRGGAFHGGGDTFDDADDPGYVTLLEWARAVASTAPELVRGDDDDEGYRFFVDRVQPVLVRKGCMALNCHSPISVAFNLRGGAQGSFSRFARDRNYALARSFLAIDSPDPNQSRIIAKNLFAPAQRADGDGMLHRGGPLFEELPGGSMRPLDCASVDADGGDLNTIPPYCVLVRWHEIERGSAVEEDALPAEPLRAVVWVSRPLGAGEITDFDTYRPGADLRVASASLGFDGVRLGEDWSLLDQCGIDPMTADVRGIAAAWDGQRVAFGARSAAREPLRIWEAAIDGSGCAQMAALAPAEDERDGILLHDFDPAYSPDGRLVFASTRGSSHGRPTRTPARMEPNADLYVFDPTVGAVRQLTFLLNQELAPSFMQDGRVIYTIEKRELDFHMFSLRRQLIDGGDYHPLYASRRSLGFASATEVEQLPDQNFVFIAAPIGSPEGAGSLAMFNRSLGPDQDDRDPSDTQYLHSLDMPARGVHHGGAGLYRSPSPLPTGAVLVSCATGVTDADATRVDFDLCEVEPRTGRIRVVGGRTGSAESEVVAVWARLDRGVLTSDGGGIDRPEVVPEQSDAIVHFNDFPMIQSLMFANTREGRPLDDRIGGFSVLTNLPPPRGATAFEDLGAGVTSDGLGAFYAEREELGWVPLFEDGSARMRVPGGRAVSFRMTSADGSPLDMLEGLGMNGPSLQREHEQYYPGERIQRSIPRRFFNGVCGACHGSLTGRELDVVVDLDVITGASVNAARDASPVDLMD